MQDTSVSGMRHARDPGGNARRGFSGRAAFPAEEDEQLARVLITSWSLTTGRILRGVPPQSLTEDELITFWADDQIAVPRCRPPER